MKRLISLVLAAMLVSYCGTAPHAELQGDSDMTTGGEEQGDSKTAHYVVGGVVALVALCTVIPGARRVCQKQFKSADKYKEGLEKSITKLKEDKVVDGISEDAVAKIDKKIGKLEDLKNADNASKDGFLYTAYDKTIGALGRKFKKADNTSDTTKQAEEG